MDFNLKDRREWKYSVISHIARSETEDADYERPDELEDMIPQTGNGKFTDEDYTFVQPPGFDNSDMVHLVVPGAGAKGVYAVPRRTGVGSTPNVNVVDIKQDDEGTWDDIKTPSDGRLETVHSVDYPNIYLEEPSRAHSPASSGPPRIPAKEKGKGRVVHLSPSPRGKVANLDIASNTSIVDNDLPDKPTVHIPDAKHALSPIPLISNVVRKMSLENARARTIDGSVIDGEDDDGNSNIPLTGDQTYDNLVNQLASLVQVVSQILEDDSVARQVRGLWDVYSQKIAKEQQEGPRPASAMGGANQGLQPKELAIADGIAAMIKRMSNIVVEDIQEDVQEQDGDVIWTRQHRTVPTIRLPAPETPIVEMAVVEVEKPEPKPFMQVLRIPPPEDSPLSPDSKRRLEDAKNLYKAEKARYRAEREQKRREKLAAKGFMLPDSL